MKLDTDATAQRRPTPVAASFGSIEGSLRAEAKLIINFSNGEVVCEHVEVADRVLRRMRGLLGRKSLPPGQGLLLRPAPSIHTAFMRFAIDVVFLDADLQVVEIVEAMRPFRVAGKREARAVLELAAGEVARCGVGVGDSLVVVDADAVSHGGTAAEHRANGQLPAASEFIPNVELSAALEQPKHNGGAQSLRVLLIAHDRRFRTVASALLARRGCVVSTSPNANRVVELVAREGADVVVIDAGSLLTAAARTVATVTALVPPVGVVLVDDEAETGLLHMPVLAKWGPFEDFFAAVERADRDRGNRRTLVG